MSDIFLKQLSYLINEMELTVPMTLYVNGNIICGTAVSYNSYINLLINPEESSLFNEIMESCHKVNIDVNNDNLYDFIHLSKVHLIHDEVKPYMHKNLIRIKLSDVSAFQYGSIDFTKDWQ